MDHDHMMSLMNIFCLSRFHGGQTDIEYAFKETNFSHDQSRYYAHWASSHKIFNVRCQ